VKLSVAFAVLASTAFAGTPAIGVITAHGQFQLEGSRVWGNSNLFDGATIETGDAASELSLSGGVNVQLAAGSSARVWKTHLELQRGTGQVNAASAFRVNAGGIGVEGSRYRVAVQGARLQIAALTGDARVLGSRGNLLASIPVGKNLSFAMQQVITRIGCLVYKAPGFLLQTEDTGEVLQLAGVPLAEYVGNRVEVNGNPLAAAPTISPATTLLNVTRLTPRATGGCLTTAAALNAQTTVPSNTPAPTVAAPQPGTTAPPTVARTGMSTGAKVGIIAAVAGGGAGAALALGGKKSSTSP